MTTQSCDLLFLDMHIEHLPEVLKIERLSDHKGNPLHGRWTTKDFKLTMCDPRNYGVVAEGDGRIVAFAVVACEDDKLYIPNLAVHTDYTRKHVGSELLQHIKQDLNEFCSMLQIDVRESNLTAQLFLRAKRFRAISVLRGHYSKPCEDAYRFQFP